MKSTDRGRLRRLDTSSKTGGDRLWSCNVSTRFNGRQGRVTLVWREKGDEDHGKETISNPLLYADSFSFIWHFFTQHSRVSPQWIVETIHFVYGVSKTTESPVYTSTINTSLVNFLHIFTDNLMTTQQSLNLEIFCNKDLTTGSTFV